jgi:hypothetical protein
MDLPPLTWQRDTTFMREIWVIEDQGHFVAVVFETGRLDHIWIFYHLVDNEWIFIEVWTVGPSCLWDSA